MLTYNLRLSTKKGVINEGTDIELASVFEIFILWRSNFEYWLKKLNPSS